MGNYRSRIPGEKCEQCKVGFLERIVIQPTAAESIFCVATLGIGGDGGSQHFKCSNCHTEYDNTIYDITLAEDKPYTVKDHFMAVKFIFIMILFVAAAYLLAFLVAWIIGSSLAIVGGL